MEATKAFSHRLAVRERGIRIRWFRPLPSEATASSRQAWRNYRTEGRVDGLMKLPGEGLQPWNLNYARKSLRRRLFVGAA